MFRRHRSIYSKSVAVAWQIRRALGAFAVCCCALAAMSSVEAHSKKNNLSLAAVDPRTGLTLPASLGAFTREGGVKYDPGGNPTASYYAGRLILLDMYYYKHDASLRDEFASCRDYVKMVHPTARLVSDDPVRFHGPGRRAAFIFNAKFLGGAMTRTQSELLIFLHRDRFLKFRISYPAAHASRARQEAEFFVKSLTLP